MRCTGGPCAWSWAAHARIKAHETNRRGGACAVSLGHRKALASDHGRYLRGAAVVARRILCMQPASTCPAPGRAQ
eukprot:9101398-Pyramimonas_sp.AAC.2